MFRLALALLCTCVVAGVSAVEYRFPPDAGIIDVKRDFGATGDGVTDDTAALKAAIQTALKGNYRNPRMIYLPIGTYLISEPLKARTHEGPEDGSTWCNGWRCGLFLTGESRERTIIRLRDAAPGFQDPAKAQPVIITGSTGHGKGHDQRKGGFGNEGFQNTLMNFTLDTGSGNPGASGVDFLASNRGTMEEVTVRSGDGAGVAGLDLTRAWPGPALIKNVSVEGFDYGLRQKMMDCSMTYEHLTFSGQRVAAVRAYDSAFMTVRGLVSRNAVPALLVEGKHGIVTMLDSQLTWTGSGTPPPAIVNEGYLTLHRITIEGYATGVAATRDGGPVQPSLDFSAAKAGKIEFYSAREPVRLHEGPIEVPSLPVKETPLFHHSDFAKWANPRNFSVGSRTAGIQEAIDSGAEIIYLPNGTYPIEETIILRGKVCKIMGLEAQVSLGKRSRSTDREPTFRFVGGAETTVILEHLIGGLRVEHAGAGTLVIRKCNMSGYWNTAAGTGPVFIEDVMGGRSRIEYPQDYWARQLNAEFGDEHHLVNFGGRVWVLGMKIEGHTSAIHNVGGVVECHGLYTMIGKGAKPGKTPFVENIEGWLIVPFRVGGQGNYDVKVADTWNGKREQRGGNREYPLTILGQRVDPAAEAPGAPGSARAAVQSHDQVELHWDAAKPGSIALRGYRIERNGDHVVTAPADATTWMDTGLNESTASTWQIRAVDVRGGVSAAVEVSATTSADRTGPVALTAAVWPGDTQVVTIDFDQPLAAAAASKAGSYRFDPVVPVRSATLNVAGDRVILQLGSPVVDGQRYTVHLSGLTDRSQAANTLAEPQISFEAWELGDGLLAEFFDNNTFTGEPVARRVDARITEWWGDSFPVPELTKHPYGVRWSGTVRPRVSGDYVFNIGARAGARLFIDGKLVHDVWNIRNEWTHSKPITLEAGRHYKIVFEGHASSHAGFRLKWELKGENAVPNQFLGPEVLFSGAAKAD